MASAFEKYFIRDFHIIEEALKSIDVEEMDKLVDAREEKLRKGIRLWHQVWERMSPFVINLLGQCFLWD